MLYKITKRYFVSRAAISSKSIYSIEKKTLEPISLTVVLCPGMGFDGGFRACVFKACGGEGDCFVPWPSMFNYIVCISLLKSKTWTNTVNLYFFLMSGL